MRFVSLLPLAALVLFPARATSDLAFPEVLFPGKYGIGFRLRVSVLHEARGVGIRVGSWSEPEGEHGVELTEWIRERYPAEVQYVVPIRVAGWGPPMVLARIWRSNWLDYRIFSVTAGEVRNAFSFSGRDEDAVRFRAVDGHLREFTVYDRWMPVPERLKRIEKGGPRWMLVSTYRVGKDGQWVAKPGKWTSYMFGSPIPKGSEQAGKFSFLWK